VLATPEQSEDAAEDHDRQETLRPTSPLILLDAKVRSEPETALASELPSEDERETAGKNGSKISRDE